MTDKRRAMAEELMDWVSQYKNSFGCRPTQEEVDEFMEEWSRKE